MPKRRQSMIVLLPILLGVIVSLGTAASAVGLTVRGSVYHLGAAVKPGAGLGDGQFVRVTWHGLGPQQPVFFRQCTAKPTNTGRDCTALYSDTGFTGANGSGVQYEPVHGGLLRSQSGAHFTCSVKTACTFGVFTGSALKTGRLVKIKFAPTPDGCPVPVGTAIAGGGADQANHAVYDWGLQICEKPYLNSVTYVSANSQDGRSNYIAGLNDFAVTAEPFTQAEQKLLAKKHKQVQYAPIASSGLVLAYKIFSQGNGAPGGQVTDLRLTPALIAQIFTGQLTNWQTSPDMTGLNPGDRFPPTVRPLVRGDHSVANTEFTTWLTKTGGSGLPTDWPGASDTFPIAYLTQNAAIVGGDALANAIADPFSVGNSNDYYQVGYIGFIDSSEAAYYGLPAARIQNSAGKYVTATPAAVRAALKHATKNPDGVTVTPNYTTTDPAAYPMPVVSYVAAPIKGIDPNAGWTLRQFLTYASTKGQRHLPAGYTQLTPSQVTEVNAVIPNIPATPPPDFTGGTGGTGGGTTLPPGGGYPTGGSDGSLPPSDGTTPPTDPASSGGGSSSHLPHLLSMVLTAGTGKMVLPAVMGLSLLGLIGGLLLLHFGTGATFVGDAAGSVRGWLRL